MLPVFTTILFFAICAGSYARTRSIVHPAFVVSGLWTVFLFAYQTVDHGLYPLSVRFYYAILLWVSLFCGSCLLVYRVRIEFPRWLTAPTPNVKLLKRLFPLLFLLNVYYLLRLYTLGGGGSFYGVLDGQEMPADLTAISYLNKVSLMLCFCMLFFKGIFKKYQVIAFVVLLLACYLLVSVKTFFAQMVCALFFYLWYSRQLSFKKVAILFTALLVLLSAVQIFRSDYASQNKEFDAARFLTIYTLSPLPAFDMVVNGDTNFEQGRTLRFFKAVAATVGVGEAPTTDDENMWVQVPIYTNVFTVMLNFYVDYGYWGIAVFAVVLGLFWGVLYKGVQYRIPHFVLVYAMLFYSLPLEFFADYIFTFLSITLQIFIITHLFFVRYTFLPKPVWKTKP